MKKVFAVLFFFLFLCGCSKFPASQDKKIILHSSENIVSSVPGDFDGDKYPEYIYVANSDDGSSYIKLIDGDKAFYKELDFKLDNYTSNVQDVNNDNKEDLIIYYIEENIQNVHVFSYNNELYNIFNPGMLDRYVSFTQLDDQYKVTYGSNERIIKSKEKLSLKFFYTDLDYKDAGPVFDSIGTIANSSGRILYTISASFSVDSNNNLNIYDLKLLPYIEVEDE
jgi:hypothetical protein